ncbi:FecR family protein [Carboxylicivirga sp. A043]|uniref:FecR family protein n=1 Tax=Carboxylicivirga litoralis TaxID=2816963 RepID=UPI0021CB587A|nr:FecR family protein [Carboxylicivirga sp. A043]MCU4156327.1 FecR family protein [Carboxylicivirga sp. A043]
MNLFQLSHIIVKYLKGQSHESEDNAIQRWAEQAPENNTFLERLTNEEALNEDLANYQKFDSNAAWKRFEERHQLQTHKIVRWSALTRIAAVASLLLMAGSLSYLFLSDFNGASKPVVSDYMQPGDKSALLMLNDETLVVLNDTLNRSVTAQSSVMATVKNGQLAYVDDAVKSVPMTITVPLRSEYQFVLGDGTKIWMNAGSKVSFNHPFGDNTRRVKVEGEVFLEVAKDVNRPFVVELPKGNAVQVLGTQFNVKAYADEIAQQVVLVEGSVLWKDHSGTERIMEPGQLLSANQKLNILDVRSVDTYPYIAWTKGYFVYDGETLEEIMRSLSRWYGVEVRYQDDVIKDLHFSIDVKRYENLNDILTKLEVTEKIYFTINGSEILVSKK